MQEPSIEIAGRKIGKDYDPLVIAEIGINHNGDLKTALEMVDAAVQAGAEIIKHQTHIVEDEMSSEARSIKPGNSDKAIFDIMAACALNEEEEIKLQKYVESKGLIFISTPFSRAAADRLMMMKVPAFKIGSGECNNYPLLEHIASAGKPVIMSTGMNTIESVRKAVSVFERNRVPVALLHTTNLYPTPDHLVRLGAMVEMAQAFPNHVYGLSDHTVTNHACFGAVALGASILERHFTDHMGRSGPDIVCSMDIRACRELIEGSKIIKQQRGGRKGPAAEEQVTINFAFASICSIKEINKGDRFTKDNIWVKRPGVGELNAEKYETVLGKIAARDIPKDVLLKMADIA